MNPRLFAETPPAHLICRVCRGVYREPRVNQCGHTLCSGCYNRLQSEPAEQQQQSGLGACPQCGSDLVPESSVPNRDISEEVEELSVHCVYHFQLTPSQQAQAQFLSASQELAVNPNGCGAQVPLVELDSHMSTCEFRPVACPFDTVNCQGCCQRDLLQHSRDCIFRLLELTPREILNGLSARQSETLATLSSLEGQLSSVETRLNNRLNRLDAVLTAADSATAVSAASTAIAPPTSSAATPMVSQPTTAPARHAAPAETSGISALSRATSRTNSTRSALSAAVVVDNRGRRGVDDVFDFGGGGVGGGGVGAALGRSPSLPVGTARVNGLPSNLRSYLTCVADLTWHSNRVASLLLIPDQFHLVSLDSTGAIVVWNIQQLCSGHAGNARAVERLSNALYTDSFVCACRVPGPGDDKYVFVGCRNGSLVQFARFSSDLKRVKTETGAHSSCVTAVTASPRGLLFSGSRGQLKVWKSSNMRHLQTVSVTPRQTVRCLTFDAWRGALLCACETELHRFLVREQSPQQPPQQPPLQQDLPACHQRYRHQLLADITCLTVTEDRILLGTRVPGQSLWLFCAVTGRFQACLAGGAGLSCLVCAPDGSFAIAGCQNGSLQVWRLLDHRHRSLSQVEANEASTGGAVLRQQTERHRDSVTSISLLRDLLFTGSGDGWMKVFRFHP